MNRSSVRDTGQPPPTDQAFDLATLTPAERRVFEVAIRGVSVKEIATELHVTEATVASHLSRMYAKLGVRGRAELIARASRPTSPEQAGLRWRRVASPWAGIAAAALALAAGVFMPLLGVILGPFLVAAAWQGRSHLGWARWVVLAAGVLLIAEGLVLMVGFRTG